MNTTFDNSSLWGALSLSYKTLTGWVPCPSFSGLPICFLVVAGYTGMLADVLSRSGRMHRIVLYAAWAVVFVIAAVGTGLELATGEACPSNNSGLPLCYFSLGFCFAIMLAYEVSSRATSIYVAGPGATEG